MTITRTGKPWPDGERRLDVELAADDLLAGLVEASGRRRGAAPGRVAFLRRVDPSSVPTPSKVESAAALDKIPPMIVDPVLEPGVASASAPGWRSSTIELAVGKMMPVPDEQDARLAEGDLAVVVADQLRALRDEEEAPVGLS